MPGVVLAILDVPEGVPALLAAATRLAALAGGAALDALVVRAPPEASIVPSEQVLTVRREAELRAVEEQRALALAAATDAWVRSTRHPVRLIDVEGLARDCVAARGRDADFIVLPRPGARTAETAHRALRAALFETGRPVLIAPPHPAEDFGHTVAVAWRDDGHAANAVLPMLRMLPTDARVHVIEGTGGDPAGLRLPRIFAEHGVDAVLHPMRDGSGFGPALLERAHQAGADMLVMGAYAHTPLREAVFGGVTRYILAHADLPVLMRH
ncbi:MAG: universal stress protein [Proteobacteria bacterium]|nr:universal stress protein [Pseudomonadota bacterium]